MKVEVTEIHEMNMPGAKTQGCLRAYATIKLGELTINKVKLIKQPGQKPYITAPQFEYYANGRVNYIPIVRWPQDWHDQIFAAVYAAYTAQRQGNDDDEKSPQLEMKINTNTKEN